MKNFWFILVGILLIVGLFFLFTYNSLVTAKEKVDNQWAQVESQYQRRIDLIPNLVNAVKGEMTQEKEIFLGISEARKHYIEAKSVNKKIKAVSQIEGFLSKLFAIMENYPQLKSAENVQTLMVQLEGTENRINVARQRYNDAVRDYNILIKRFPTNLIASYFGYTKEEYFQPIKGADQAPKIDLSN